MPQAFCLIVGISVLTYLGVIKFVVGTAGKALAFFLQVSPPEGVNMVGNIFLHVVGDHYISISLRFISVFLNAT